MRTKLARAADLWIARWASPDPQALRAAEGLTPAVVVCGGSRGIGLALASEFLSDGRAVVLVARDAARLEEANAALVARSAASGARIATVALDLSDVQSADILSNALKRLGFYMDTLVVSAGTGLAGPFTSHDPQALERLLQLNVSATTRLIAGGLPGMVARGRGGVLAVSSLGGYVPGPNQAAYYASKAYLCSLGEAVGTEVSGSGVRVTVLAPGPVNTGFHAAMGAENSPYRLLLPGLSPERAARAAVWGYQLGRRVVVPGLVPKLLAVALSVLPHWITRPVVAALLHRPSSNNQKQ